MHFDYFFKLENRRFRKIDFCEALFTHFIIPLNDPIHQEQRDRSLRMKPAFWKEWGRRDASHLVLRLPAT